MPRYHINSKGEPGVCTAEIACPFGSESEHYLTKEDARSAYEKQMDSHTFYHVSVASTRDIQEQGLMPQLPLGRLPEGSEYPAGVYIFKDLDNAEFFREVMDERDMDEWGEADPRQIWKVDTQGLPLIKDPAVTEDDPIQEEYPLPLESYYTEEIISPERLRPVEGSIDFSDLSDGQLQTIIHQAVDQDDNNMNHVVERISDQLLGNQVPYIEMDETYRQSVKDRVRALASIEEIEFYEPDNDYRMSHRPDPDGPAAYDVSDAYPDFYDKPSIYRTGDKQADLESIRAMFHIRDNPDAEVTIYRSVPSPKLTINVGDWVTLSKSYAKGHGKHETDETHDWPVIEMKVKASDIRAAGDSINELGYFPAE